MLSVQRVGHVCAIVVRRRAWWAMFGRRERRECGVRFGIGEWRSCEGWGT